MEQETQLQMYGFVWLRIEVKKQQHTVYVSSTVLTLSPVVHFNIT